MAKTTIHLDDAVKELMNEERKVTIVQSVGKDVLVEIKPGLTVLASISGTRSTFIKAKSVVTLDEAGVIITEESQWSLNTIAKQGCNKRDDAFKSRHEV